MNCNVTPELYNIIKEMYEKQEPIVAIIKKTGLRRETINRIIQKGSPKLNFPAVARMAEKKYIEDLEAVRKIDISRRIELHDNISNYAIILSKVMLSEIKKHIENKKIDWKEQVQKSRILKDMSSALNILIPAQYHYLMSDIAKIIREEDLSDEIRDRIWKSIETFGELRNK